MDAVQHPRRSRRACCSPRCSRRCRSSTTRRSSSSRCSAAVLAGLTSIPVAFAGGLALGVVGEVVDAYLPTNSVLASNLRPALPFVVLFLVLIFSPSLRNRRELADPLAGVDPPPPPPAAAVRSRVLTNGTRALERARRYSSSAYYIFFHAASNWRDVAIDGDDPGDDLPLDHRDHRHGRRDLPVHRDVRRHRRVYDRAARHALRRVGAARDGRRRSARGRSWVRCSRSLPCASAASSCRWRRSRSRCSSRT